MSNHTNQPIHTVPDGVYEGGVLDNHTKNIHTKGASITTDLQNNGYPLQSKEQEKSVHVHKQ